MRDIIRKVKPELFYSGKFKRKKLIQGGFRKYHFGIRCVAVSDDGRKVLCGAEYGKIRMWNTNHYGSAHAIVLTGHEDAVKSVAVSFD